MLTFAKLLRRDLYDARRGPERLFHSGVLRARAGNTYTNLTQLRIDRIL